MALQLEGEEQVGERIRKALRNTRRRYVVYYLSHHDGVVSLDDLTDRIAAWEEGDNHDSVPARKRKSVYSSLYQTHLPKLEEIGLVDYDSDERTVSITERGDRVSIHCGADTTPKTGISRLSLGFVGLVVLHVGVVQLESVPRELFVRLSAVWVVGLVIALLWQRYATQLWKRRYWQSGPDYIVEIEGDKRR